MRAWKLQECLAHSPGGVTCVSLGRKSGRVMATGGDDRRVKLWAVGKPTCILSLTGHSSSIESTEFSQEEDRVAAGSLSGSIRIWDLEEVKIVRTLSGHTSGINSLDFHPFGNFVVSGSTDRLVKLWDVSRKGCINTYRGHSGGVNMVRFSPDGKWVVSGGEDGCVKIWDLSAGRLLVDLPGNGGSVHAVAFHPTVLLLAAACADHTVRLYDLENFTQVAASGPELATSNIRRIAFHPDGLCLYVATTDYLKIYDYETMSCLETVHVGWRVGGGLHDMAIAPSFNQLVGVSIAGSAVSTYVVDVKSCVPFVSEALSTGTRPQSDASSVNANRPAPEKIASNPSSQACASQPNVRPASTSSLGNGSRNRKSFCLSREQNASNRLQEDSADPDSQLPYKVTVEEQNDAADISDPVEYDRIFKPHRAVPRSPPRPTSMPENGAVSDGERVGRTNGIIEKPSSPCLKRNQDEEPFVPPSFTVQTPSSMPKKEAPTVNFSSNVDVPEPAPTQLRESCTADQSLPLSVERPVEPTDSEWLSSIRKPHNPFMAVISSRLKHLSTVQMMWSRDNIKTAMETVLVLNDPAVLVDVLGILSQNSKLWNFELAYTILPHLLPLLRSKYSRHVEITCQVVHVILKNFAHVIRQTIDGPAIPGVDLMREERQNKCRDCMEHLQSIRSALDVPEVASRAGAFGKELLVRFQVLC